MSLNSLVDAVVGQPTYHRVSGIRTVAKNGLNSISSSEQPTHPSCEVYTVVQPMSTPGENLFTSSPSSGGAYTDFNLPNIHNKVQDINLCLGLTNKMDV